jgi:hypothetical protein
MKHAIESYLIARAASTQLGADLTLVAYASFPTVFCPTGKSVGGGASNLSSPFAKNFPLSPSGKSMVSLRASRALHEGRFAIVTDVGCGMRWTLGRRKTGAALKRTAKSCGPDISTLMSTA